MMMMMMALRRQWKTKHLQQRRLSVPGNLGRENRIGHPPLMPTKEMDKKSVPRGKYDYASTDGILALRWKDNKNVTLLSTDAGIEPLKNVQRFDKTAKKKVNVPCPDVIKQYNGKMGGINKSDMLVHLHKTPHACQEVVHEDLWIHSGSLCL